MLETSRQQQMTRTSPNETTQDSFNDHRDIPASEIFTSANEISEESNYHARELAQLLACVAVEEDSDL